MLSTFDELDGRLNCARISPIGMGGGDAGGGLVLCGAAVRGGKSAGDVEGRKGAAALAKTLAAGQGAKKAVAYGLVWVAVIFFSPSSSAR